MWVKHNTTLARLTPADTGLERITHLEQQLAAAPVNSRQHRTLSATIRVEADAYRKSLDDQQATATHDAEPQPVPGLSRAPNTLLSDLSERPARWHQCVVERRQWGAKDVDDVLK